MYLDKSQLEYLALAQLRPCERNARTHSKKQIGQIAGSIKAFGFTNPVLIDEHDMIIAGHGRVAAAKLLGLERVPCLRLSRLSAVQKRAYILADNKLAANAGWDREILALEAQELIALDPEFDITLSGFEIPEIESLVAVRAAKPARSDKDDRLPGMRSHGGSSVSRSGDLWVLGRHRVLCGSPSDDGSLERLMGNERAQLLFSQPCLSVLNANRPGHRYASLAGCKGDEGHERYAHWLQRGLANLARFAEGRAYHFVAADWMGMAEMCLGGSRDYGELIELCVWLKEARERTSEHLLIFVFQIDGPLETRLPGGLPTVWRYRPVGKDRPHSTDRPIGDDMPVAMIVDVMRAASLEGSLVLDGFAGCGSSLIAAHKTGRCARLMEANPASVDVLIERFETYSGMSALHADTGLSFADMATRRGLTGPGDGEGGQVLAVKDGTAELVPGDVPAATMTQCEGE